MLAVMPRSPSAPSRMEILLLTALSRAPMHGYELKLELAYKHVEWWAKCEHGHLYAALARLERGKFIRPARRADHPTRRVYTITAAGKQRLATALATLGRQPDATYFDVDVFLAACHVLPRQTALAILGERRDALADQLAAAEPLVAEMLPYVPAVGRLIMEHRVEHLKNEIAFLEGALATLTAEPRWGAFLGSTRIEEFVQTRGVPLED
jgi:DNA-binding PadR family transcriptional regulator